jgi:uncharacterized RDD family membrane protein YckC
VTGGTAIAEGPLDTTAEVETPEHVRFRHHLAGPARRSAAYLVDTLARAAIGGAIAFVLVLLGVLGEASLSGFSTGVLLVVYFALEWFYFVVFEALWSGRTPGKRALGIRVVKEGGWSLHAGDALLRNLLRAADFLPGLYALGILVMGFDRKFRRLGDLVAGTVVVIEDRATVGAPLVISPAPTAAELEQLPARPPLSADELEVIEAFLRRGTLSALREIELAEIVAPTLAARMGVSFRDPVRFLALLHERARGRNELGQARGRRA